MTALLRVYVNARPVEAPAGGTALDAIRALDAALAESVAAGQRVITDSRGLPVPAGTRLKLGHIFRVVHARADAMAGETAPPA